MIVFIPPSGAENNPQNDWATLSAESIPRTCPECSKDSIIGHGRRRKQAHDENHDWIGIRRGLCTQCCKTITFLPPFSLPYTHYSLIARSQALQRYFGDGYSLELAVPLMEDPNRVPDVSTVRRWFCSLDSAERLNRLQQHLDSRSAPTTSGFTDPNPPGTSFPFLRKMISAVVDGLGRRRLRLRPASPLLANLGLLPPRAAAAALLRQIFCLTHHPCLEASPTYAYCGRGAKNGRCGRKPKN